MSPFRFAARRATHLFAGLSLALAATACDNNPLLVTQQKLATTSVVLTIAGAGVQTQTLTWTTATGAVAPATITLPTGATRTVTTQFLRADGTSDPVVTAGDYRLDFSGSGNAVAVTKTSSFGGTITTGSTAGTTVLTMRLMNVEANSAAYTSSQMTFQVQTP
jgi:hypothetical protein